MNFSLLFKPQMTFPVGNRPWGASVVDLNNDNCLDIVTANYGNDTISVLFGRNNEIFLSMVIYAVGLSPDSVVTGDFNADDLMDVVVTNRDSNNISVLLGQGDGHLSNQVTYPVGLKPSGIDAADLNQDGNLDIIVSNAGSNTISILIGKGDGTFLTKTDYTVDNISFYSAVKIFDINNDKLLDIVVTRHTSQGTVSILLGEGNGKFSSQIKYNIGSKPWGLAITDLDNNGKPDILIVNYQSATISVLLSDGKNNSFIQQTFPVGAADPKWIAVADLNKDSYVDVIVTTNNGPGISVLLGLGNGSLATPIIYAVGIQPFYVCTDKINEDDFMDILIVDEGSSMAFVLFSNPEAYSLIPNNHIFYPSGKINFISQFDPTKDKIDLTAYPGVTYSDLRFEQAGNDTIIRFIYPAVFLVSAHLPPGQTLTTNNLLCASAQAHPWLVQQASALVPTNGTILTQFDPHQNQIDLRGYNISCQSIQIQVIYNLTVIQFNYPQPAQITVSNTKPSDFSLDNFILPLPPPESRIDKIIRWVKVLAGPVGSVFSTAIGIYLNRGLIQNILYASSYWKGDRYIKEAVWAPKDEDERRELTDRHGMPIPMRDVDSIKLFTVFEEETPSLFTRRLPNYYALRRQSELIDQKLVITKAMSNKAWIKLNPGVLDEEEIDSFFIQVVAKSGAILEQFKCSLENLNSELEVFSLDISAAPGEEDTTSISETDHSNTAFSVNFVHIQWSNPILQDLPLLQWAYRTGGIQSINRLIEIGADSNRYRQFEHLERTIGTEKAIEAMWLSEEKQSPSSIPIGFQGAGKASAPTSSGAYMYIGEQRSQADNAVQTLKGDGYRFQSPNSMHPSNLFWIGMIAYRLPAAYDQTQYLLKIAGFDLQTCYETQGVDEWTHTIGSLLRPSLLLGGATIAYCTSADPLVLLVAANQPGFSGHSDLLSEGIYYLTTILSFARAYAHPSAYTLPLVALQGTNLVSHLLVDTGLVAEDNHLMQWMQSATGLASETLGFFLYPDLPIKALQGISLLAQSLHCAELAGEYIAPYFAYAQAEETIEANQTQPTAIEDLVAFS